MLSSFVLFDICTSQYMGQYCCNLMKYQCSMLLLFLCRYHEIVSRITSGKCENIFSESLMHIRFSWIHFYSAFIIDTVIKRMLGWNRQVILGSISMRKLMAAYTSIFNCRFIQFKQTKMQWVPQNLSFQNIPFVLVPECRHAAMKQAIYAYNQWKITVILWYNVMQFQLLVTI